MIQEEFACTRMVEALETRTLLSANPELVADIVTGAGGSFPSQFVNVNGTLFFSAFDNTNGSELWQIAGTETGTTLVNDIRTGSGGSNPYYLTNVNGTLFFRANDGTNGEELWRSDGTSIGTTRVKDIFNGSDGSFPHALTNVNGTLFFLASDGTNGSELWRSDGTSGGTTLVKDRLNGIGGPNPNPSSLTNVNGTLFFCASDDEGGYELWQSDGTSVGTILVKDLRVAGNGSNPSYLTNVNGTLFFRATDGTSGYELWQSDGTAAGTKLVKDLRTGSYGSYPRALTNVNGTLFFSAFDGASSFGLWQSDGTAVGTTLVKDVNIGGSTSNPFSLTNVNGTLFFGATDGTHGYELWQSDGTSAGTSLVKDAVTGVNGLSPFSLTNMNGTLFFSANDGSNGYELWKAMISADTPKVDQPKAASHAVSFLPPALVDDIFTGGVGSSPYSLTNVNGTLFFRANDGANGLELWKSDGTVGGTTLVKDISSGSGSSYPFYLTNVNGMLFFNARDATNGVELWRSDGTAAGTRLVKDINNGDSNSNPGYLTNVNGTLFFRANDGTKGYELWQSDGTVLGTTLVKDIVSGISSSFPLHLTNVNGTLFFRATDGINGVELWQSDGTAAGTTLVKDIVTGSSSSYPRNLTNMNGTLFFNANDGTNGAELWQSDGTAAGTRLVKDINPGSANSNPFSLTNLNGTLFFSATDGTTGYELWQSDGTASGTALVKDIVNGTSSSNPSLLTNVNGTLFFSAFDSANGYELWKSGGTAGGTTLVKDIVIGHSSSNPIALTNVNGTLFFGTNDGTNGVELWSIPVNARPGLTTFATVVDSTDEDTEVELTFAELLAQSDATDADGTVDAFIVQAVSSGTLKLGTSPSSATAFAGGLNERIDGTLKAYWTPVAKANGNAIPAFTVLAQDNIGDNSIRPITADITVTAIANTPSVTNAATSEDLQTSSGLVISRNAADGPEVTHFKITGIAGGSLFQKNGTTAINDDDFITFADANVGLRFTPTANSSKPGHFTVQASTSGKNSGLGGSAVTANITIIAVADTPNVTNAVTTEDVQSTIGLVISRNAVDGSEVTHFKITGITGGTLFQNDGTTPISNDQFVTFAQANAGLKFTPTANSSTPGHFTVQASTSGINGRVGGSPVMADITITAVADTPNVTNAATTEDGQTKNGLIISRNAADGAEVTHIKITGIAGGSLFQNNGITPISNNQFITFAQANAGLKFMPTANSSSPGHFTVQASTSSIDAGLGGSTVTATVAVTAVADLPSVTNAATFANVQTTSGLVISRNAVDGSEVTYFKVTNIIGGSLFLHDGMTQITDGDFITFAQANSGLKFTPASNSTATGHFTVQASTSNLDAGIGGITVTADIAVTLPVPTMTGPTAVTTSQRPTISWNAVSGADRYVLFIANLSSSGSSFQVRTVTGTSYTPTADFGIGAYEVRVRAISASGDSSAYSQKLSFRISTPTDFGNVDGFQATTTPTLIWNPLVGAVKFDLWINNLSTGQQQIVRDMNVTGTTWTSPTSLSMGKYRAWIRGTDVSGLQANWSMAANFYVLPPVTVVSPVAPTFDRTPTFTWNPVPGAVSYDLYYQNHTTGSVATLIMNISGNTFTPSSNLAEGNYQWHVIAVMQGNYRSQSATRPYFYVGGRPTVLTPTGSTLDTTPTITWTPVTGAVRYKLLVSRTDVPTNGVISQTSLITTSFTPTTALPKGSYRAWVLAISSTGSFSLWSDPVSFSVTSSDHDSSVLPGALLPSDVTVLEDMSSQIRELASSDSEDVAVVSQETYVASEETAQLRSEFGNDQLARVAAISQSERGRSRFSSLELSTSGDEAGVDALMADVTSMMQVFEI